MLGDTPTSCWIQTRGVAMADKFTVPKLPAGASRGGTLLIGAAIIGYGISKSVFTGRKTTINDILMKTVHNVCSGRRSQSCIVQ